MKSFESEIKAYAEKTRLKISERAALRERILSYMEYHPLKKDTRPLDKVVGGDSVIYVIGWGTGWVRGLVGGALVFLFIGVPFLAERAVPGDMLYLVKTGVNESIQTQLATSPYEKVTLETRLIERRIAEARVLAEEGKLTPEVEAHIAETVKGHASAVQTGLTKMKEQNVDDAAMAQIAFSSALEVQSAVLGESSEQSSSSVTMILGVVNSVRAEVASDENATVPSYESIVARIETETTRAYELFATIKGSATEEEIRDIERRLSDIDRSILEAKELQRSDEPGAIALNMETLGLIQKLIAFMTDIDVRETVALETLVPITLTPDEEQNILGVQLRELKVTEARLTSNIDAVTDIPLREKIVDALRTLGTTTSRAEEMLLKNDFDGARETLKEGKVIEDDLVALMSPYFNEPLDVPVATTTEPILGTEGEGTSTPTTTPPDAPEPIPDTTEPVSAVQ